MWVVGQTHGELTDGLERSVREGGAEVVVEETLQDVERDVGEAGVDVGVDGQDHGIRPDHAAGDDVPLEDKDRRRYAQRQTFGDHTKPAALVDSGAKMCLDEL